MTAVLLPDDPAQAEQVVRLLNDRHALLLALKRMREERDFWRGQVLKQEMANG